MTEHTCPDGHITKDEGARTCPQCGAELPPGPKESQLQIVFADLPRGRTKKPLRIVIGALAVCCFLWLAVIALFLGNWGRGPLREKCLCTSVNQQSDEAFSAAQVAVTLNRLAHAERLYRRAIELDAGNCDAMDNLGLMLRGQGRIDEAISWYKRSIEVLPTNHVAHMNLGVAYQFQGKYEEATGEYRIVQQADPANPEGYFGLAQCYVALERYREAITELEAAEALYAQASSPLIVDARALLGAAHYELGECGAAKGYFEAIYAQKRYDPSTNYYLGLCCLCPEVADKAQAARYLDRAKALGAEIPEEVKRRLE